MEKGNLFVAILFVPVPPLEPKDARGKSTLHIWSTARRKTLSSNYDSARVVLAYFPNDTNNGSIIGIMSTVHPNGLLFLSLPLFVADWNGVRAGAQRCG